MIPSNTLKEINESITDIQVRRIVRVFIRKALRESYRSINEKSQDGKVNLIDVARTLKIIL